MYVWQNTAQWIILFGVKIYSTYFIIIVFKNWQILK